MSETANYRTDRGYVVLAISARHADGSVDLCNDSGERIVGRCQVAAEPLVGQCRIGGASNEVDPAVDAVAVRMLAGGKFTAASLAKELKADQLQALAARLEVEEVPAGTKEEVAAYILENLDLDD